MGLLDFLFGKLKKIENEFFGIMLFFGYKKDLQKSYLEYRRHFDHTNELIEIGINGDISGAIDR